MHDTVEYLTMLILFLPHSVSLYYDCSVSTPLCVSILRLFIPAGIFLVPIGADNFVHPWRWITSSSVFTIPGKQIMCTGAGVGGPETTSEGHRQKEAVLLQQTRISSAKFTPPFSNPFCAVFNFDNKWLPILNIQAMVIMAPPFNIVWRIWRLLRNGFGY
jgi:hypothetical protein